MRNYYSPSEIFSVVLSPKKTIFRTGKNAATSDEKGKETDESVLLNVLLPKVSLDFR